MRLPFIQLDGDFIAHRARDVAVLLGCSRAQAVGHLSLLWAWAISRGPEDAPPSGLVTGQHAVRLLEGAAEWEGPAGAFFEALCDEDVRLLEKTTDGVRIRGMDRYAKAWEKQRKDRERKAGVRATSSGIPSDGAGKTQTQTQTQEKQQIPAVADAPPEPGEAVQGSLLVLAAARSTRLPKPSKPRETTGDPRHAPLVEALVACHENVTNGPYGFRGGRDAKAVKELLGLADQDPATRGEAAPAEVCRRWAIGLAWRWANGDAPVQTLSALAERWNECKSTDTAPPASARRRGGSGPPPPSDWSTNPDLP